MKNLRYFAIILIFITIINSFISNNAARADNIRRIGDIVMVTMPISAIGGSIIIGDTKGVAEFTAALGVSLLTYAILNPLVAEKRPQGDSRRAFPSGHAIAAFSSSFYLWERYGFKIGVPATALAAFVGYTRIEAKQHYPHDILASAAISGIYTYLLVNKYNTLAKHFNVSYLPKNNSFNLTYYTHF